MYLLHIKPIPPERANHNVTAAYEEIKEMLHITTVPLVFQYIAIYEQYFFYLWERIKRNLESDTFHESCAELKEITYQTVGVLQTPSLSLQHFVKEMHPSERYEITEVVNVLDDVNIKLMLITIGIRESLKGIPHIGQQLLDQQKAFEDHLDSVLQIERLELQGMNKGELTQATRMLAPLLGSNTLMISRFPDFFAAVATEMKALKSMPAYLHLRVEMEHQAFARIDSFPQPLDCSYVDFLRMTEGIPYTDEIVFLLKDTFPSQFPHLMLTTAVMKNALAADDRSNMLTRT
jgi:halocarboxylic acid dehydrogenase DehI